MNLLDYEAGGIIGIGQHLCKIVNFTTKFSKSNTEGLCVEFKNEEGQTINETFWLSEKALYRLAKLAKLAKLSESQRMEFYPEYLIDKFIEIKVEKSLPDEKGKTYSNIVDYFETDKEFLTETKEKDVCDPYQPEFAKPETTATINSLDDIPF